LVDQAILPQVLKGYLYLLKIAVHDLSGLTLEETVVVYFQKQVPEALNLLCDLPLKEGLVRRIPLQAHFR